MTKPSDKLEICKMTRQIASEALCTSLKKLLESKNRISEVDLRDKWLLELRKNRQIFSEGWFTPPPHGMTVLFGTDKNTERVSPSIIRFEEYWPRKDIILNTENGIALVYTSPVDKSGVIGDFGMAIYFGQNKKIQNHLKTCLTINKEVFDHLRQGLRFYQIHSLAMDILNKKGLISNSPSLSDPAGTNIGHTIPFSYENPSYKEKKILYFATKDWEKTKNMIAKKRKFVSQLEKLKVYGDIAFTLEPRPFAPDNPKTPTVWYHTIVLFRQNGSKELLQNFNEIFKLAGMDYMLHTISL